MRIVDQCATMLHVALRPADLLKRIEQAGRVCYKSEANITIDSAREFVRKIIDNGHHSVLEHGQIIMRVSMWLWLRALLVNPKYLVLTAEKHDGKRRYLISGNVRAIRDFALQYSFFKPVVNALSFRYQGFFDDFITDSIFEIKEVETIWDAYELSLSERSKHLRISFHIVTDIGVGRELLRHRVGSPSQESTRYVNYQSKGFEIINMREWLQDDNAYRIWLGANAKAEDAYNALLNAGVNKEFARAVLPLCTKTEIVKTMTIDDWYRLLDVRYHGSTGRPHPMMRELAGMIKFGLDAGFPK